MAVPVEDGAETGCSQCSGRARCGCRSACAFPPAPLPPLGCPVQVGGGLRRPSLDAAGAPRAGGIRDRASTPRAARTRRRAARRRAAPSRRAPFGLPVADALAVAGALADGDASTRRTACSGWARASLLPVTTSSPAHSPSSRSPAGSTTGRARRSGRMRGTRTTALSAALRGRRGKGRDDSASSATTALGGRRVNRRAGRGRRSRVVRRRLDLRPRPGRRHGRRPAGGGDDARARGVAARLLPRLGDPDAGQRGGRRRPRSRCGHRGDGDAAQPGALRAARVRRRVGRGRDAERPAGRDPRRGRRRRSTRALAHCSRRASPRCAVRRQPGRLRRAGARTHHGIGAAAAAAPSSLISLPGAHAFVEAMDAVQAGALGDAVLRQRPGGAGDPAQGRGRPARRARDGPGLRHRGRRRPRASASRTRCSPGRSGIVAASGTGAQQVSCLLDAAGRGRHRRARHRRP